MTKRIDPASLPSITGTLYPSPFDEPCRTRQRIRLGDAAGLTQYGVNLLRLPPGAWSSQRHWHTHQDEFIYVLSGEVVLVSDAGDEIVKGRRRGRVQGRRHRRPLPAKPLDTDATCSRSARGSPKTAPITPTSTCMAPAGAKPAPYCHRDGTPYPKQERRGA
jgi:hypothetical protein